MDLALGAAVTIPLVGRLVPSGWSGGVSKHLPGAGAFFASRALNAALLIGQLTLIARLYSTGESARFFVYWTLVWCGSVWIRFGFDQLIPKHAAVAELLGDARPLGGFRQIVRWTFPALALASPALVLALVPHVSAVAALVTVPAFLGGAVAWMAAYMLGGLAKGYGHVGLSGLVVGVVPAACALVAVPIARLASGSWLVLAWVSAGALVVGALIGAWRVQARVGGSEIRTLMTGRWATRKDQQVLPAGILVGIGEASIWLPLWIGSALSLRGATLSGLYAAIRLSAAFSWLFSSIVNAVTPMLAGALARQEYARVRQIVIRSASLGALSTAPVALLGIVVAAPLLNVVHAGFGDYADVLAALIGARLVDAATGAVGETLILGDRAGTELFNQAVSVIVIVVLSVVLKPELGVLGIGVACAAAYSLANLLRVAEVTSLLRGAWSGRERTLATQRASNIAAWPHRLEVSPDLHVEPSPRSSGPLVPRRISAGTVPRRLVTSALGELRARDLVPLLVLAAATASGALLASVNGLSDRPAAFWVAVGSIGLIVMIAVTESFRRSPRPRRLVWISPAVIAAGVWLLTFVLRPVELNLAPDASTYPLFQIGFTIGDLTRALGVACAGCGAWSIAYLLSLGRRPVSPQAPPTSWPFEPRRAMLLLVVGTVLWGTLFMRQGGPSALLHSAASIRAGQESSFYGFLGIWLVQGVALYTWAAFLNGGGREAKRVLMLSVAISLIGGLCLEVRGLTAIAFAASLLIYLRYRRPSRRTIALAALIVVIGVPALALASTVRNYTQLVSTSRAVSLAFSTPPTSFDTADLSPFDNLVAIRKLVPTSVPSLNGSTLVAIPLALVPRSVWSGKPQPLDLQVTSLLYPGGTGGSPIMMQGELYWDLGLAGVILGAGMLGALIGMTARRGAAARTRYGTLAYAVFVPSTLALLTRALATMTGNLVIALVGVGASAWLLSWERRRPARSAPADELTTPSLASASARSA